MPTIPIASTSFESLNVLAVDAGTNCPRGGDSGHGGRTLIRFTNEVSTDMRVCIDGELQQEVSSVELVFGGDTECQTVIQALEFALGALKAFYEANSVTRHEDVE